MTDTVPLDKVHIIWRPVNSGNVGQVGWPTGKYNLLLVRFTDGRCYGYLGVSRQRAIYMATRCASVGKYLAKVVRPQYQSVRLPELDSNGPPF